MANGCSSTPKWSHRLCFMAQYGARTNKRQLPYGSGPTVHLLKPPGKNEKICPVVIKLLLKPTSWRKHEKKSANGSNRPTVQLRSVSTDQWAAPPRLGLAPARPPAQFLGSCGFWWPLFAYLVLCIFQWWILFGGHSDYDVVVFFFFPGDSCP